MQFYYQPKQHYIDEENDDRPAIWVERIWNHKGSTSGASSGDFHAYRRMKRAEAIRRTEQEEEDLEKKDHDDFQSKREVRIDKYNSTAQKKREKRLKKEQKTKDSSFRKKLIKTKEKVAQQQNKFKNDGSFLAKLTDAPKQDDDKMSDKENDDSSSS